MSKRQINKKNHLLYDLAFFLNNAVSELIKIIKKILIHKRNESVLNKSENNSIQQIYIT